MCDMKKSKTAYIQSSSLLLRKFLGKALVLMGIYLLRHTTDWCFPNIASILE